jgi:uncharacterized membrane protein (TIGR02234 family)
MTKRVEFALAVLLDLLGAGAVLLIARRTWQTVRTPRPRPLADDVLDVSGHVLDAATTALGLVALAGVVAVLATRGAARRGVGALVAVAGAMLAWRSIIGLDAVSAVRARALVRAHHAAVGTDASVAPHVTVHAQWPALSIGCGLLIVVAGLLVAVRGGGWAGMSARYDAPSTRQPASEDVEAERARADASMWTALDRGDDPTSEPRR